MRKKFADVVGCDWLELDWVAQLRPWSGGLLGRIDGVLSVYESAIECRAAVHKSDVGGV